MMFLKIKKFEICSGVYDEFEGKFIMRVQANYQAKKQPLEKPNQNWTDRVVTH